MPNIIISLVIGILSLHVFTITYRVNGVNRTLFNIPISIFESSIPLINYGEEQKLYFDKELLENKLTYYFDTSLDRYVSNYSLEFYYYNQENESICKTDQCSAIEITLSTNIIFNYKYQKSASFYIRRNT